MQHVFQITCRNTVCFVIVTNLLTHPSASISSLCRHSCSIITSPHFLLCSHLTRVIQPRESCVTSPWTYLLCLCAEMTAAVVLVRRTFSFSINKNCEYVRAHVKIRLWLQCVTVLTLYDIYSLLSRVWPLSYMLLSCVLYIIPNVSNNQAQTNPLFHFR